MIPLRFSAPLRLPTAGANLREHWSVRQRRAKEHRFIVGALAGKRLAGLVPCIVTLTRVAPRALDDDNLAGAFKHVRDGIAELLGVDDRDPRVEWRYGQERGAYAVRIEVSGE